MGRFAPTVQHGLEAFCAAMPLGLGAHLNEFAVGIVLKLARVGIEAPLRLTRVWFAHQRRHRARIGEVGERLGAEDIARALAITHRTLQRRLTAAGTSYREVLVHVRRRRRAVLRRARIPETKVAELLGFADVRAMKRSLD